MMDEIRSFFKFLDSDSGFGLGLLLNKDSDSGFGIRDFLQFFRSGFEIRLKVVLSLRFGFGIRARILNLRILRFGPNLRFELNLKIRES